MGTKVIPGKILFLYYFENDTERDVKHWNFLPCH